MIKCIYFAVYYINPFYPPSQKKHLHTWSQLKLDLIMIFLWRVQFAAHLCVTSPQQVSSMSPCPSSPPCLVSPNLDVPFPSKSVLHWPVTRRGLHPSCLQSGDIDRVWLRIEFFLQEIYVSLILRESRRDPRAFREGLGLCTCLPCPLASLGHGIGLPDRGWSYIPPTVGSRGKRRMSLWWWLYRRYWKSWASLRVN